VAADARPGADAHRGRARDATGATSRAAACRAATECQAPARHRAVHGCADRLDAGTAASAGIGAGEAANAGPSADRACDGPALGAGRGACASAAGVADAVARCGAPSAVARVCRLAIGTKRTSQSAPARKREGGCAAATADPAAGSSRAAGADGAATAAGHCAPDTRLRAKRFGGQARDCARRFGGQASYRAKRFGGQTRCRARRFGEQARLCVGPRSGR